MADLTQIKNFWEQKAVEARQKKEGVDLYGNTLNDKNLRNLEIEAICKYLMPGTRVLDLGCGNGFSTCKFAEYVDIDIRGMDYSDEMISNANNLLNSYFSHLKNRVSFKLGDVLDPDSFSEKYDMIITERCLINLGTWENQQKALMNIAEHLNKNGLLIMLEGFRDKVEELNVIRKKMDLQPIEVVWHNCFFEKLRFEEFILKSFNVATIDQFGSTYMLLTRTIFHKMQDIRGNTFDKELDRLATLLPNMGNHNYQQLYILRKK